MAELFFGPVVEKLVEIGFQYLEDQPRWQTGMKKELESLRDNYHKIKAVDFASCRAQIGDQNSDFNNWQWQLRDAIDEADDVLDEFEYMNHERQLMQNKKQSFIIKESIERALQIDPNLKRLEEVVKKLASVLVDIGRFENVLQMRKEEQREQLQEFFKTRETGSLPTDDLIGRGEDKEFVMQWLKKPSNEHQTTSSSNISLLSIVGHGGMGKTTLAQHVYSETTTNFDHKIWVCVSTNYDAQKVIADILGYIKKDRPRDESLGKLQETLKSEVESKKFLLVLDDIWAEEKESDKSKWKNVFAPLAYGSLGSKILITTRMHSVASMIAKLLNKKVGEKILTLKGLEEDNCLQLLNSHAFAGVENSDDHEHLKFIAGQIVKKLSGSPLAAKVIGGALNESLDKRHWQNILNSDIMQAESGQDILSVLKLSYIFLPKHLQNCFAFCCIFKQDHEFDKDDLVRMWIALGFIQPSSYNQKEALEDIGGRYFELLIRKSFFGKFQNDSRTHYKMHDLLHELAQSVSAQECLRVMSDEQFHSSIPETIRHLYVKIDNLEMLNKIGKFKHLRSLFLKIHLHRKEWFNALTRIFKSLGRIRLLYVYNDDGEGIILKAIENLIHLRYFKFDKALITQLPLPRPPSKLYHLRFLICDFMRVFRLPKDCHNLISLGGHQKVETTEKYQLIIDHLWICDPFVLLMEPLRNITALRELRISDNDELVSFPHEVEQWFPQVSASLRELTIHDLKSLQSLPSSLESLTSLKILQIWDIPELQVLPKLPASLERLYLIRLESLQCLPPSLSSMSALKSLELHGLRSLSWLPPSLSSMSVLNRLSLSYIPLLKSLPDLPPSPFLESLDLWALKSLQCLPPSLSSMSVLWSLVLRDIPLLKSLPDLPPSLEKLELYEFNSLQCLPPSLSSMSALKSLDLSYIPLLMSLPKLPPSLERLYLDELESLQCLPPSLSSMSALKNLDISGSPLLKSLPDLPPSLEYLYINGCHKELKERYDSTSGVDRDKLPRIRNVEFYDW